MSPTPETRERRSRWLELAITIAVSAVTSAVAVSWSLAGTLSKLQTRIEEHDRRIANAEIAVGTLQTLDSAQSSQIAVGDARYAELIRRVDQLDQKFDRVLTRIK